MMVSLALSLFTLAFFIIAPVKSGVTVLFEFKKFDNTGGKAFKKNTLCDDGEWFHRCETYFEICIKPARQIPYNLSDCWYFLNTSRNYIWKDNIDFQINDVGVPRVIKIHKQTWPIDIGFFLKAWDWDGPDTSKSTVIDIHAVRREMPAGSNGTVTKFDGRSIGQRPNHPATQLTFEIRVMCDVGYFGPNCENYCDYDWVGNHSRCGQNGSVICESGWYNTPLCDRFCVSKNDSENGYYTCNKDGTHACRPNWHNPPNCKTFCAPRNDSQLGYFSCSKDGSRLCHDNWMGEFCNVSKVIQSRDLISMRYTDNLPSVPSSLAVTSGILSPSDHIPSKLKDVSTSLVYSGHSYSLQLRTHSAILVPSNPSKGSMNRSIVFNSYANRSSTASRPHRSAQQSSELRVASTIQDGTSTEQLRGSIAFSLRPTFPISTEVALPLLSTSDNLRHAESSSSYAKQVSSSGTWHLASINVQRNHSGPPPFIDNDKESKEGLEWLIKSSRGNMALIGFSLALLFFMLLVIALCRIHRLRRQVIRRIQAADEKALNSLHQMRILRYTGVKENAAQNIRRCNSFISKDQRLPQSNE